MSGLTFVMDGGHGWLAVPLAEYPDAEDYGTGYGYIDRAEGVIYLEEDCEATAFDLAHPGLQPKTEVYDGRCFVRRLPRNEARWKWDLP